MGSMGKVLEGKGPVEGTPDNYVIIPTLNINIVQ
jgi:hypothetical protein